MHIALFDQLGTSLCATVSLLFCLPCPSALDPTLVSPSAHPQMSGFHVPVQLSPHAHLCAGTFGLNPDQIYAVDQGTQKEEGKGVPAAAAPFVEVISQLCCSFQVLALPFKLLNLYTPALHRPFTRASPSQRQSTTVPWLNAVHCEERAPRHALLCQE